MSRSTPELREAWEARVAGYQSSGQSIPAWCAEHKVNLHTMRYWVRKLNQEQRSPETAPVQWLSVEVSGERHHVNAAGLVVNVGDARIEVHPGCDLLLLREVVHALASLC